MNEREIAVLTQLHQRYSHVSAERVISGPGLVNLYEAVCALEGVVPEALTPAEWAGAPSKVRVGGASKSSVFSARCSERWPGISCSRSAQSVGLYIGGGIVPRLGQLFRNSAFRDRFEDKGRYADYLGAVPVYVIRTKLPAFVGLAHAFDESGTEVGSGLAAGGQ